MGEFQAAGVRPVAISVDSQQESSALCKKAGYTFTFLSDPKAEAIRRYALLHVGGGPDGHDISRPAEFLVDPNCVLPLTNFTEDTHLPALPQHILPPPHHI